MRLPTLILSTSLVSILIAFIPIKSLSAQSDGSKGGVLVAPAFMNAQIGTEQPEVNLSVGVKNNYASKISINASPSGLFVKNNTLFPTNQADTALELLTTITPTFFELDPGEAINIKINIKNSPGLKPGGHYLSLLIKQVNTLERQLSVTPAVGATIFVIKEDGAVRKVILRQIDAKHSLFSLPKYADIEFKNAGNVSVVPRGVIFLTKNGSTDIVSQGVINTDSVPLFQGENIKLRTKLKDYNRDFFPGKYKLSAQYRYEYQNDFKTATITFWYIPKSFVLTGLFTLFFLIWILKEKRRRVVIEKIKKTLLFARSKGIKLPVALKFINRNMVNSAHSAGASNITAGIEKSVLPSAKKSNSTHGETSRVKIKIHTED